MKEELKIEIPEEPAVDDPDVVRIVLKLPHGSRIERRFLKNQSLKVMPYKKDPTMVALLYNWSRCACFCKSGYLRMGGIYTSYMVSLNRSCKISLCIW